MGMLGRIILAAVLSAVAMFFWGFVFWGPVLNMTGRLMGPLPETAERDVLPPLRAAQTPDGMYVYPGPMPAGGDEVATEAWEKKLAEGPVFHLAYHQSGVPPMDPVMFAKGLAHSFVVALLSALILAMALPALPDYGRRVVLLALVAFVAAIWTNAGNVIWWFHTPEYCMGQIAYTIVAGLLMALITAAIVRPRIAI
jgi:hypothetical protein